MPLAFGSKKKGFVVIIAVLLFFAYFCLSIVIRPFAIPIAKMFLIPPQICFALPICILLLFFCITFFNATRNYNIAIPLWETNLSLVSSRLIRIELEGKELRKTVENIPKYVPPPEKVELDQSNHFYEPFMNHLKEWTHLSNHELIYDSDADGLTARSINYKIQDQKNVMILIQTDKDQIFGCFSSETIPPSEEEGYGFYVRDDSSFFAFALKGKHPKPIMFKKKDKIYSLKVYSHDNDQWLIGIHCGFYIGTTTNSFISNKFNAFYECSLSPDLFTGSYFPSTFSVNRVLALRWD
ncbi:TLDc domain-containing protein [Entamoeba marina]